MKFQLRKYSKTKNGRVMELFVALPSSNEVKDGGSEIMCETATNCKRMDHAWENTASYLRGYHTIHYFIKPTLHHWFDTNITGEMFHSSIFTSNRYDGFMCGFC